MDSLDTHIWLWDFVSGVCAALLNKYCVVKSKHFALAVGYLNPFGNMGNPPYPHILDLFLTFLAGKGMKVSGILRYTNNNIIPNDDNTLYC